MAVVSDLLTDTKIPLLQRTIHIPSTAEEMSTLTLNPLSGALVSDWEWWLTSMTCWPELVCPERPESLSMAGKVGPWGAEHAQLRKIMGCFRIKAPWHGWWLPVCWGSAWHHPACPGRPPGSASRCCHWPRLLGTSPGSGTLQCVTGWCWAAGWRLKRQTVAWFKAQPWDMFLWNGWCALLCSAPRLLGAESNSSASVTFVCLTSCCFLVHYRLACSPLMLLKIILMCKNRAQILQITVYYNIWYFKRKSKLHVMTSNIWASVFDPWISTGVTAG